mgnify:CR=1 FL=1
MEIYANPGENERFGAILDGLGAGTTGHDGRTEKTAIVVDSDSDSGDELPEVRLAVHPTDVDCVTATTTTVYPNGGQHGVGACLDNHLLPGQGPLLHLLPGPGGKGLFWADNSLAVPLMDAVTAVTAVPPLMDAVPVTPVTPEAVPKKLSKKERRAERREKRKREALKGLSDKNIIIGSRRREGVARLGLYATRGAIGTVCGPADRTSRLDTGPDHAVTAEWSMKKLLRACYKDREPKAQRQKQAKCDKYNAKHDLKFNARYMDGLIQSESEGEGCDVCECV